ncbi:hypothetical protein PoB_006477600 [Plakobranchus ocellatus]|uniref:Uncharacterized protein n=1 Tax=Plakobranchus ocellatus TaxID=259542 RepID=A0AAV4D2F8_9GAST|nr:hypothetical protein PoB_006477600 [Plakobranchus ocellatus]
MYTDSNLEALAAQSLANLAGYLQPSYGYGFELADVGKKKLDVTSRGQALMCEHSDINLIQELLDIIIPIHTKSMASNVTYLQLAESGSTREKYTAASCESDFFSRK